MKVFKPDIKNIVKGDYIEKDNDFYQQAHGLIDSEFTVCGVACEEWDYDKMIIRTKITCPKCLEIIRECKTYKF